MLETAYHSWSSQPATGLPDLTLQKRHPRVQRSPMTMKVAESSEGVKGDSANNVYKPAVMETGLIVQVPLFINQGERINVKTEDNSYLGRA